jgi:aminodeoxyfutalosine synthase
MPTPFLERISDKVEKEERLSTEEALTLLNQKEPEEIAATVLLANRARKKKVGDEVLYASTLYFYPTNLCELNCQFCSFYAKPGWKNAWFLTPEQAEQKVAEHLDQITEVHIVGGLWRECDLHYYEDLFKRIKSLNPQIHIKALTPVEYDFLAKLHNISIEEVLKNMISWGLGSLPGGGAEILVEEVRKKIAPGKITSNEFLEIHRIAHSLGLRSNMTMLFNHVETNAHIATHLDRVRSLQDETGGFKTFIPLKFGEEDNALGKRKNRLEKKSLPLVYAVCRLYLDNFPNLKVLWNYVGIEEGLQLLNCGANDFSSIHLGEKVIDMAGGVKLHMDEKMMRELIEKQGRIPTRTHSGELLHA